MKFGANVQLGLQSDPCWMQAISEASLLETEPGTSYDKAARVRPPLHCSLGKT
jgi:hypothetical protein